MARIANSHDAPWLTNSQTKKCFQFMLETHEVHVLPLDIRTFWMVKSSWTAWPSHHAQSDAYL